MQIELTEQEAMFILSYLGAQRNEMVARVNLMDGIATKIDAARKPVSAGKDGTVTFEEPHAT